MAVRPFATLAAFGVASVAAAADICPPRGTIVIPCPPGVAPAMPGAMYPGTSPMMPPGMMPGQSPMAMPGQPPTAPLGPIPPVAPGAMPAAPQLPANNLLAQAESFGSGGGDTAFPNVFGDLFGGGFVAGPLPVRIDPVTGRILSTQPILVNADGSRSVVSSVPVPSPSSSSSSSSSHSSPFLAATSSSSPSSSSSSSRSSAPVVAFLAPPGTLFDKSLAPVVSKIPTANRGTFKLTENDTPRPTDRFYVIYNYYDEIGGSSAPDVPRIRLHQETFGFEKAFADRQFSVGLRLPYNQFVSPGFFNDTGLGDITIITKAVIREDRATGDILSGGLALTVPTGSVPTRSSITGDMIHATLFQPYLGYLKTFLGGDAFTQGFSAVVVPTDSSDVTLLTQTLAAGYFLYRNPDGRIRSIVPVAEAHLNVPLNHRGINSQPVGFVDTLTLLTGAHVTMGSNATFGAAVGAPVTGPRPFSLQVTVNVNVRY